MIIMLKDNNLLVLNVCNMENQGWDFFAWFDLLKQHFKG